MPSPVLAQAATKGESGLSNNVAGALAYVRLIPAIIFLLIDPFKNIRFARFPSLQCIFFCIAAFVLQMAIVVASIILGGG